MVYYAMPLIMKTENGTSSQQQQLCMNANQVVVSESNFSNGQLSSPPQPHQPQLINLSNGDVNDSSSQNSYTYQLLTSNDQQQPSHQQIQSTQSHTTPAPRTPKTTKSFKCDQCDMMFTTKSAHTSHIKSHAKQQQQLDGSTSVSANGASTSSQSSDPYQCDVCKKTFAVPARLVSFSTKIQNLSNVDKRTLCGEFLFILT